MFGVPATGRTVEAVACMRIAEDRIVEWWTEADLVGLLGQLRCDQCDGSGSVTSP